MTRARIGVLGGAALVVILIVVLVFTVGGGGSKTPKAAAQQSVTIALAGEPSSMDPSLVQDGNMNAITPNIYEGLTARDDTMKIVPQLATSWTQTAPTTWTFAIRPGVKFQDGEPFDAAAAAFSINRVVDPANKSQITSYVPTVVSASAVGTSTVSVTTKGPDPNLPGDLYYVPMMPPTYVAAHATTVAREPIGTGPYKLTSWQAGQKIVLTAWSGYWGTKPKITTANIVFRPDSQVRLAALKTGEIQLAPLDPTQAPQAPKSVKVQSVDVAELGFDAQPGRLLADQRIRLAINLSIDRSTLISSVFGGFAVPSNGQLVPPSAIGYNPDLKDYAFDLPQAQALVKQAGAVGKTITFVVEHGRWTNDAQAEQAIAAMIEKTGLKVKVVVLEFSEFLKRIFDRGAQVDLTYFASSSDTFESNRVLATLVISPKAGGTLGRYTNPTIDSMYQQALAASTIAEKDTIYRNIWKTAFDASAVMPLAGMENIFGTGKNITWTARADGEILFANIGLG